MNRKTLSDKTGVSIDTLRYYETLRLITPNRNPQNGYRTYAETDEIKLHIIIRFKGFGFTLQEIKTFFDLLAKNNGATDFQTFVYSKLADIDSQIAGLKNARKSLLKFQKREDIETCAVYSKLLSVHCAK